MTTTSIAQRAREAAGTTKGQSVTFPDVQRQLVRGGYLRANLSSALTEFDIIAGGLAWGIRNSRYTIDVEFVENASIRDKLKVSENICNALQKKMQCPIQLLPHQIQGLDFTSLAIVIKWLLQRVAMAREDNAAAVSKFTSWDFARKFKATASLNNSSNNNNNQSLSHFTQTHQYWRNSLYRHANANQLRRPQRKMISSNDTFSSPVEHANAILLEYGDQYLHFSSSSTSSSSSQQQQQQQQQQGQHQSKSREEMDAAEKQDLKQQKEEEEKEKIMLENLLKSMSQHTEKQKVGSNELGAVLAAVNTKKLSKLQKQFDDRMSALQAQLEEENQEKSRVEAKRQEISEKKDEYATLEVKANRSSERLERAKAMVEEAMSARNQKKQEVEDAQQACEDAETKLMKKAAKSNTQDEVRNLLDRAFELQRRITEMEEEIKNVTHEGHQRIASMKKEIAQLTAELEQLVSEEEEGGAGAGAGANEENEEAGGAEDPTTKALEKAKAKTSALEAELSRLDMDILSKQRDIDSILTRAEYVQYEQRLEELDEECACKYDETQLLVREQNLQNEIRRAIENEDDVLTNIFDSVKQHLELCTASSSSASSSSSSASKAATAKSRESLQNVVAQVQDFLKDISALRDQQDHKLQQETHVLVQKRSQYDSALAKQRAFRSTVDEVARQNEKLSTLKRNLRELRDELEQDDL